MCAVFCLSRISLKIEYEKNIYYRSITCHEQLSLTALKDIRKSARDQKSGDRTRIDAEFNRKSVYEAQCCEGGC